MKHLSTFTHNLAARNLNKVLLNQIEWCFCVFHTHAKCLYVHVSLWAVQSNGSWPLKEQARWNMHDRRESSLPQHTEMFLPPSLSQGVKHWWAAGAAAEPLDGALSFSSGGLASSHLILDFTHGTKEPGGFTSKKGFSLSNPALHCVWVCVYRATDDGAVGM